MTVRTAPADALPRPTAPDAHWRAHALLAAGRLDSLPRPRSETRFLNDDYLFLEQARTRPLARVADLRSARSGTTTGRCRGRSTSKPWRRSRAEHPLVFHLVELRAASSARCSCWPTCCCALLPTAGAMAGLLVFALLPFQRVDLMWVSCSAGPAGARRRARDRRALPPRASRAGPAHDARGGRREQERRCRSRSCWRRGASASMRPAARRVRARIAPFASLAIAWGAVAMSMRAPTAAARAPALRHRRFRRRVHAHDSEPARARAGETGSAIAPEASAGVAAVRPDRAARALGAGRGRGRAQTHRARLRALGSRRPPSASTRAE